MAYRAAHGTARNYTVFCAELPRRASVSNQRFGAPLHRVEDIAPLPSKAVVAQPGQKIFLCAVLLGSFFCFSAQPKGGVKSVGQPNPHGLNC